MLLWVPDARACPSRKKGSNGRIIRTPCVNTESDREFGTGRFLARDFMKYGWGLYAPTLGLVPIAMCRHSAPA